MRSAATIAIVATRLRKEAPALVLCAAVCAAAAYLQRFGDASVQLASALVFGTLAGVAIAMLQRAPGRFREIELCESCAPLYGRELARATAAVPFLAALGSLAAYWAVAAFYRRAEPDAVLLSLFGAGTATLLALPALVSSAAARSALLLFACAAAAAAYLLYGAPIAVAIGAYVASGFLALRQYGEALARYDPLR